MCIRLHTILVTGWTEEWTDPLHALHTDVQQKTINRIYVSYHKVRLCTKLSPSDNVKLVETSNSTWHQINRGQFETIAVFTRISKAYILDLVVRKGGLDMYYRWITSVHHNKHYTGKFQGTREDQADKEQLRPTGCGINQGQGQVQNPNLRCLHHDNVAQSLFSHTRAV